MKRFTGIITAAAVFASLLIYPDAAKEAVTESLGICGSIIIPSLFPFFVAAGLMTRTGAASSLGKLLEPLCRRLFGVSGSGVSAFIIGISGGYPLGAAHIAGLYSDGEISAEEAAGLLVFCNNSGPAFIIGAAGVGVFSSVSAGLFLYAVHIVSAVMGGILFSSGSAGTRPEKTQEYVSVPFAIALTDSIKLSVSSCITVCGFIVAFSIFTGILDEVGILASASARLAMLTGTELTLNRALLHGILELGGGIAAMSGLGISPLNLGLAAFIIGFGSISVHFQTFAVLDGLKINAVRYVLGRLVISIFAFALALLGGALLF